MSIAGTTTGTRLGHAFDNVDYVDNGTSPARPTSKETASGSTSTICKNDDDHCLTQAIDNVDHVDFVNDDRVNSHVVYVSDDNQVNIDDSTPYGLPQRPPLTSERQRLPSEGTTTLPGTRRK